jgi:hypothetical protein
VEWIAYVVDPHPSHRTPPQTIPGVPYIGHADVDGNGRIKFDGARSVSPKVLIEHKGRYVLHHGDFAFGKVGTLGEPFLLPPQQHYALSANVILIQPRASFLNRKYLFYYFTTNELFNVVSEGSSATSQAAFGIMKLRDVLVPTCSFGEQSEIVRRIENSFAWIDRLAAEATSARKLINHLDQAILTKAFRGELVSQDPNDEHTPGAHPCRACCCTCCKSASWFCKTIETEIARRITPHGKQVACIDRKRPFRLNNKRRRRSWRISVKPWHDARAFVTRARPRPGRFLPRARSEPMRLPCAPRFP